MKTITLQFDGDRFPWLRPITYTVVAETDGHITIAPRRRIGAVQTLAKVGGKFVSPEGAEFVEVLA